MAASRSYFGRGNHRYFSGEKEGHSATNSTSEFNEFDVRNTAASPELHKTVTGSQISKKSAPETENRTDVRTTTANLTFEFNEVDVWNTATSLELHKTVTGSRISKKSAPAENRTDVRGTTTNLTFEFNEIDVWNAAALPDVHKTVTVSPISKKSAPATENQRAVRVTALSVPVDVPDWSMILKEELTENRKSGNNDDDFDADLYGAGELIPPHEYLARGRIDSFSVHEGFGRTLKGRDLSRVRNAVWKKIGFED